MARSNSRANNGERIVIPPAPAPGGPEGDPGADALDEGEREPAGQLETWGPVDNEGLNTFRETGDAAALADASFADWTWQVYRYRTTDEVSRDRKGNRREWMARLDGPLELTELRRQCGGGSFEIWGYYAKRLRCRLQQDIAGPRRTYERPEAAALPPAPAPPGVSRDDSGLVRLLEQQGRTLEAIARRLEAPTQQPGMGVADVLALADRLNQREAPSPSGDVLREVVGAFKMGMELRADAAGGTAKSTAELALEKFAPVIERIALAFVSAPRRPPGPAKRPAPPSGSSAEVVEPAAAGAPPVSEPLAEPDPGAHRWPAVVEALANAVARGDDPGVFVDTLELLLPAQELGMLRMAPAESVIAQLRESAGGQYPVLATDQAAAFVQAALAELNGSADGSPD